MLAGFWEQPRAAHTARPCFILGCRSLDESAHCPSQCDGSSDEMTVDIKEAALTRANRFRVELRILPGVTKHRRDTLCCEFLWRPESGLLSKSVDLLREARQISVVQIDT